MSRTSFADLRFYPRNLVADFLRQFSLAAAFIWLFIDIFKRKNTYLFNQPEKRVADPRGVTATSWTENVKTEKGES